MILCAGESPFGQANSHHALRRLALLLLVRGNMSCKEAAREREAQPCSSSQALWRSRRAGSGRRSLADSWPGRDLERLFALLATGTIRPSVAERISFDEVAEAHRRLEAGGLEGKLVLCPDLPSRRDRLPPKGEAGPTSARATPEWPAPAAHCLAGGPVHGIRRSRRPSTELE